MTTIVATPEVLSNIDPLKDRLKSTWMKGDYDIFSRYMEGDARLFYQRLALEPGQTLLDVACGAGQLALIAARAGTHATGCDIAVNWVECARTRAAQEKLTAHFDEGDAEALPYQDGQFDVVASVVGAMFAPRPELVAAELLRVCRPGGRVAMINWTAQGFIGKMFKLIAKYIAPNGMPSPLLWGDESTVRQRFGNAEEVQCTSRFYLFDYPFPPEEVVEFFRNNYGPMSGAFAALDADGKAKLKEELVSLWAAHNRNRNGGTTVDAEYLEVIAIRGKKNAGIALAPKQEPRAQQLAERIEEGAARLADFAEGLTDAEWNTPVNESGKTSRTVGVLVHHVASLYPLEVELARIIASGEAVAHVTWDLVSELNAKHAAEHSKVSKAEALELLRRNSKEAAASVSTLSDQQLNRAAPFSLNAGAPVTAQFVIEDHAMRHSWHHLASIRKALGHKGVQPASLRD